MAVPTNLIPTRVTQLPEYTGTSTLGYIPYILGGVTYKVLFANIAAVGAVPSTRVVASGTGLTGGGDLSADRTITIAAQGVGFTQLATSGVVAGTYGAGASVPVLTVDDRGRVTSATTASLIVTGFVPTSRTVTAGNGLLGGGSLAADLTFSVNYSATTPQALGTASAGTSTAVTRGDHVHPAVDLSAASQTQGALPLGRGGTGSALSPIAGAVAYSTGSVIALTSPGSAGQVLKSTGTGIPVWATVTGTVSSVDVGGGTTGLTTTGGPITGAGTITLAGTLAVANGGTGTTTSTGSGNSVLATSPTLVTPALGTPSSVVLTSATGLPLTTAVTGILPVVNGGTGASTLTGYTKGNGTGAFTASATIPNTDITGLGTMSTQAASAVAVTGGTINGTVVGGTTAAAGTFTSVTSPSLTSASGLNLAATGANAIAVSTNGAERMRINSAGNILVGTSATSSSINCKIVVSGTNEPGVQFASTGNGGSAILGANDGGMGWYTYTGAIGSESFVERMRINSAGNVGIGTSSPAYQLQLSTDSAAKPSTSTWTIASDARVKTETGAYTKGLDAVCGLRPITYTYNGAAGFAADGKEQISIIAQEAVEHFPECVGSFKVKLHEDDETETDVLNWNGHALTFALVNAVKELRAMNDALTARVSQLESK